ncbi:ABC transporter permease [uncultured Mucilaginibacter sp.]|uniref:ABC transporter permease n=1 Tax=uncultured Mucilaginibacter sp. TaxID=797541 RepID=UPI0026185578|nr:ABC transporter permease [uncultured Mucilaginibacter sp.]
MIKNYLKIAWRNFYKQKFYSGINVFGLAIGISCSIVLFLFINYHLSFDTYHTNAKRIFRTVTDLHIPDGSIDYDQGSPYRMTEFVKGLPSVTNKTALLGERSFTVSVSQKNKDKQSLFYEFENIAFTDNNWFKIFTYHWKCGNPSTALSNPYTAVITSNLAKKYFNTDQVVGKTIQVENKYNFTITGVLQDNPSNTDIQSNLFLSIISVHTMFPEPKEFWTDIGFVSSKNYVFLLLNDEHAQEQVEEQINATVKKNFNAYNYYQFRVQPLTDIHFNPHYSGKISKPLLWVLALVGFALILIACVNFVNMATAQSLTRAKEIGTRKVLGSSRKAIFWQFIAETAFVALSAGLLGLLLTILFLPTLNNWLQIPLAINYQSILFLMVLLLVIVFVAGFYPAVILSGFKPVDALKNRIGNSNTSSKVSRNVLIILQNVIAQSLIVCTIIIVLQVKFLRNADLGFNKDAIIMVPVPDHSPSKLSYFRNQLSNYPGIKSVTFCYKPPSAITQKGGSIRYDGHEWEKFTVSSIIGDQNYIKTFGLKLLVGRNLSSTDTTNAYIVNQQVLRSLGIKKPEQAIGRRLTAGDFGDHTGTIIGVVKDFNIVPLTSGLAPALITAAPTYFENAAVKITGSHQHETLNLIQQQWQKTYPQNAFEYHFLDEQLAEFYQKEEMIGKLITAGTVVAILISCLGLLGLISLMTVQRTKEIGIRKVLGATVSNIVALISKDFIKLIALAVLISTPFAWWAMHNWLESFAYRINISWWIFALTGILAIVIALLTISFQSVKAALANPVKSLRSE